MANNNEEEWVEADDEWTEAGGESRIVGEAKRPGLRLPHPDVQSTKYTVDSPETSNWDAATRSAADALTLGHGNEIQGLIGVLKGRDYDDTKKAAANAQAVTDYDNPLVAVGTELASYLLPFGAVGKGGKMAKGGLKALATGAGRREVGKVAAKFGAAGTVLGEGKSEADLTDAPMDVASDALKTGAKAAAYAAGGVTAPFTAGLIGAGESAPDAFNPDLAFKDRLMAGAGTVLSVAGGAAGNRTAAQGAKKDRAVDLAQDAAKTQTGRAQGQLAGVKDKLDADIIKRRLSAKDTERQAEAAKARAEGRSADLKRAQTETPERLSEVFKRKESEHQNIAKGRINSQLKDPEIMSLSPEGRFKAYVDALTAEAAKTTSMGKRQQLLKKLEELKRSKQGRVGNFAQSDSQAADLIRKRFAAQGKEIPEDVAAFLESAEANTENWAKDRAAAGPAQQRAEMEYLREVEALTNELATMDDGVAGRSRVPADAVKDRWVPMAKEHGIDVADPTTFDPFAKDYKPKLADPAMMTYRGAVARKMQQLGLDPGNVATLDPANPPVRFLPREERFVLPEGSDILPDGPATNSMRAPRGNSDTVATPKKATATRKVISGFDSDPESEAVTARAKRAEQRIFRDQDRASRHAVDAEKKASAAAERAKMRGEWVADPESDPWLAPAFKKKTRMEELLAVLQERESPEAIMAQGRRELEGLRDARSMSRPRDTFDLFSRIGRLGGAAQETEAQLKSHSVRAARAAELEGRWSQVPALQKFVPAIVEASQAGDPSAFDQLLNALRQNPTAKKALEEAGL